jgi:phosphate starvation-inducible PhoH-like protein
MEKVTIPLMNESALSGVQGKTLKKLESRLGVSLSLRGDQVLIDGDVVKVAAARHYFDKLRELGEKGHQLREEDLLIALDMLESGPPTCLDEYSPAEPLVLSRKSVNPKSLNQQAYLQAIKTHDLVFGIGPAGTGKTYLAMAMALAFLQNKAVNRIILTGDLIQKINPYLRPLYDALFDLFQYDQANRLIERGVIEIAPLAFMRGRTLNGAFIILDEAQNTTREQMKMILTRAGFDSKLVITADITQIDLPQPRKSGVIHAMKILAPLPEIAFIRFNDKDVVRHPLVQKIIKAYQKAESSEA